MNFSQLACMVKWGHWSVKYALIRIKLLFLLWFHGWDPWKILGRQHVPAWDPSQSWVWECFGGRLLLAGWKSCWVASRRAMWATKDKEYLSATKGSRGGGWDMETCCRVARWASSHQGLCLTAAGFCTDDFGRVLLLFPGAQGWGSTMPVNLPMILAASHCSYLKIQSFNNFFPEGADPITQHQNLSVTVTPRPVRWDVTLQP